MRQLITTAWMRSGSMSEAIDKRYGKLREAGISYPPASASLPPETRKNRRLPITTMVENLATPDDAAALAQAKSHARLIRPESNARIQRT
jgi:hypothetical protein